MNPAGFFKSSQMNNNITVGQYQQLYAINKSEMHEVDKMTHTVAVLSGKSNDEIEEMSVKDFNLLVVQSENILQRTGTEQKPKRYITVMDKKFAIIYHPNKLHTWQIKKMQELIKAGIIENMHKLMALLTRPAVKKFKLFWIVKKQKPSDFESVAEIMRHADFNDINTACNYFIKLWNVSIKALQPVIAKELIQQPDLLKEEAEYLAGAAVIQAQIRIT